MATSKRKGDDEPIAGAVLRRRLFVLAHLQDPARNATRAAETAGYSARTAHVQGSRLLKDPAIQAELSTFRDKVTTEAVERASVDKTCVLRELERIAFSDVGEVLDFNGDELKLRFASEIPEDARRALKSVKVRRIVEGRGPDLQRVEIMEFTFWNKLEALVRLGSELGLTFPERHEHTGAQGEPIAVATVVSLDPDERRARLAEFLEIIGGPVQTAELQP